MRVLAAVLATAIVGTGCASNSFRIPNRDLQQLAQTAPEQRGQKVRVIQELNATPVNPATPVEDGTAFVPNVNISISTGPRATTVRGGGGGGGLKGLGGGSAGDGKAAAIALVVVAAVILVAAAGIEGSRFDGYARLHPMHPVHLIGRDGSYTVLPLAWIDPSTAEWAETAIVKPNEGPWHELDRAPLTRTGGYYGMYAGASTMRSADGTLDLGTTFTIQGGFFPSQQVGVVASVLFGWRDNALAETMFESRYTLELQAFPVVAGPLHLGLYGGGGFAYRREDGLRGGNAGSGVLAGGAMLQLDVNTRVALTARFGVAQAHDEYMKEALFGLAVY
ncbi:MAG: hypothetical protein KF773_14605 [Deltaproteobacteria bacterium]|nr:hypothetical protein [Deltaproteobacteria bacterium]